LNLNTPSPKRSRRELSLKEKYDLIQTRWIPFTVPTEIHSEEESDPDDDIPLAQLICVVRQGADALTDFI
jgi:hypothetical protein